MQEPQQKPESQYKEMKWGVIGIYAAFGPLAGYIVLFSNEPVPPDALIFIYFFGICPAIFVGTFTAVFIEIFTFWSNESYAKLFFLGPLLGAFFAIATTLSLLGDKHIVPLVTAGVVGAILGTLAYKKAI